MTLVAERLCGVGDEGYAEGSRVLIALCGPSGEAGPLLLDLAAFAAAAAESPSDSSSEAGPFVVRSSPGPYETSGLEDSVCGDTVLSAIDPVIVFLVLF